MPHVIDNLSAALPGLSRDLVAAAVRLAHAHPLPPAVADELAPVTAALADSVRC